MLYQQQFIWNSYCAVLFYQYLVFLTFGITAANRPLVRLSFYVARRATRSISTSPGWDAGPSQGYPQHLIPGSNLYTWVQRGTLLCESCPRTQCNFPWPGFAPGARFSKLPVIIGPVRQFCFSF